jgi:hypothetical protein
MSETLPGKSSVDESAVSGDEEIVEADQGNGNVSESSARMPTDKIQSCHTSFPSSDRAPT